MLNPTEDSVLRFMDAYKRNTGVYPRATLIAGVLRYALPYIYTIVKRLKQAELIK